MLCMAGWAGRHRRGRVHNAASAATVQAVRPDLRTEADRPERRGVSTKRPGACVPLHVRSRMRISAAGLTPSAGTGRMHVVRWFRWMPAFGQGRRSRCPVERREQTGCCRSDSEGQRQRLPIPAAQWSARRSAALAGTGPSCYGVAGERPFQHHDRRPARRQRLVGVRRCTHP